MLNYIKSECYRVIHGKGAYTMLAVLCGISLLFNTACALGDRYIPDFRYGTFRFALNTFTGQITIMMILGAVAAGCLFSDDRKNGVLKNAVAYGISRPGILIGKCAVCFLTALAMMIVVFGVHVGSAYLLLKEPEWLPLREMLTGIGAALPSAAAFMVLMIFLCTVCQKEMEAVLWWALFYYLIPMACFFIGMKVEPVSRIAEWMPYTIFNMEAIVSYDGYACLWDTAGGFAKCVIAGMAGVVIFLAAGIRKMKKQEF